MLKDFRHPTEAEMFSFFNVRMPSGRRLWNVTKRKNPITDEVAVDAERKRRVELYSLIAQDCERENVSLFDVEL